MMIKQKLRLAVFLALLMIGISAQAGDGLAKEFIAPPDEAKPWVNMFWIGKITTNDITQHMEELRAKGVGGAMLIDLNAAADAPYMSGNWRELFRHSVREADRLGANQRRVRRSSKMENQADH